MRRADRIVAAARALIGVPFRLHGRHAETGLDCIGLAVVALERAGHRTVRALTPAGYGIRGGTVEALKDGLCRAGLRAVRKAAPGDMVLVQAGPAQIHLMIASDRGHIHAHAGLRRVVEMPGASSWPVLAYWRWGR